MIYYGIKKENNRLWIVENQYNPDYELKTQSVFSQCNGYMGIRASQPFNLIEDKKGMFLSGAFNKAYQSEVTELVNCPDLTYFFIEIDGEKINPERQNLLKFERKLDTLTGELSINYKIHLPSEKIIAVNLRKFASIAKKHIFAQKLDIEVLKGDVNEIKIKTGINGQITNSGVSHFIKTEARVYNNEFMELKGFLDDYSINEMTICKVFEGICVKKDFSLQRRSIYGTYKITPNNRKVSFEKISFIDKSEENMDSTFRQNELTSDVKQSYNSLFDEHKQVMHDLIAKSQINIDGITDEEQIAIAFAQYHIIGMTPWDTNEVSIAAKGLTGEGYKGHVFWDTEIFILPFLLYSYPKQARKLLEFRYNGLNGARKKAKDYGFEGAMFPWEAAKTGEEETPLYAALNIHTGKSNKVWSGIKEYHITADIVYAIEQYYTATNDWDFMNDYGCEMIFEAAKFWFSCSSWNKELNKYVICDVIGPDEYTEHIDNNAYTNYMALYCIKLAIKYYQILKSQNINKFNALDKKIDIESYISKWSDFEKNIYLPVPQKDGIIPQDDTFLSKPCIENIDKYKNSKIKQSVLLDYSREEIVNMQVLKQADVVMLLNLFPDLFSREVVKKNVLFYESRTIHDSSLSFCSHAQACAMIGEKDLSWKFFEKCLVVDINDNPHDSTDGIHSASLGGIWNCLVFGFAGIRYQNKTIYICPNLPKHWKQMCFKMIFENQTINFKISNNKIILDCESENIKICINDSNYILNKHLEVSL